MESVREEAWSLRRFGYPMLLLLAMLVSIAAHAAGLSLLEPAASAGEVLVVLGLVAGTVWTLMQRSSGACLAAVAATLSAGAFMGVPILPGAAHLVPEVALSGSLLVLLVGAAFSPGVGDGSLGRKWLQVAVFAIGWLALALGILVGGFFVLLSAVHFGPETTHAELSSPRGDLVLVTDGWDAGAMGDGTDYSLRRRILPFLVQDIQVPFDDGFYQDVEWIDDEHLAVDGSPWAVRGAASTDTRRGVKH